MFQMFTVHLLDALKNTVNALYEQYTSDLNYFLNKHAPKGLP